MLKRSSEPAFIGAGWAREAFESTRRDAFKPFDFVCKKSGSAIGVWRFTIQMRIIFHTL